MFKKFNTTIFLSILCVSVAFTSGCSRPNNPEQVQSQFDAFTNDLFIDSVATDTLSLNYSLENPKNYGIPYKETTLGEYSISDMKENLSETENFLKRLNSFDPSLLSKDQQLTYRILKKYLKLNITLGDYLYYQECLGPTTGIQAQLPILLAEYHFYEKTDIDRYIQLLSCVDDYFEDIAQFEREKSRKGLFMSNRVADSIIKQCETFIETSEDNYLITCFNKKIETYQGLTSKEVSEYKKSNKDAVLHCVIPAYKELIGVLKDLKGTGIKEGGLFYYPKGKDYYACLAASNTGSDKSMEEIIDALETAYADGLLKMAKLYQSDPKLEKKYDNFTSFPLTDPEAILADLKKDIRKDFPEAVPVSCKIKYVDESLSDYVSPAMYLTPAIDNYKDNNIYINGYDSKTLSQIYTTVAHEGYPGHLYQCVYFRNSNPSPLRTMLNFPGYDEGWATYVELYSYHFAGIDEKLADFMETYNAVNLFLCARTDIGIHYEGWTPKTIISYVGDKDVANKLYEMLLEEPGSYLPYAVGYLEFTELRKTAQAHLDDDFSLKEFHQFLLDMGPAQFDIINNYMKAWIAKRCS